MAEEAGIGTSAVGQNAPAEVDQVAANRKVPVNVDVGAVHRRHRPVRRRWRRRVAAHQAVFHLGGQKRPVGGGAGDLGGLGGVDSLGRLQQGGQPGFPVLPGLAQTLGHPVQLMEGLTQVQGHRGLPQHALVANATGDVLLVQVFQ